MIEQPQPERRTELRKIDGRSDLETALDILFARPGRCLKIFDKQLGATYNSAYRYDLLRRFLLAGRGVSVEVVLHDVSNLQRDCPRLMNLLRQFSQTFKINETELQAKGIYDPFAVLDGQNYVHRFHYDDTRGILGLDDAQGGFALVQRFEEIWEASSPAVSGTVLGL